MQIFCSGIENMRILLTLSVCQYQDHVRRHPLREKRINAQERMANSQLELGLPPRGIDYMESMRYWPGGTVLAKQGYSTILSTYYTIFPPTNSLVYQSILL